MGRVICAGSINMDIVATAPRHPDTGETVPGTDLSYFPGGKGANQAVAAARMGAPTLMLGRVGDDSSGRELKEFLESQGVDVSGVQTQVHTSTGTALIVVAESDNTIVVVPGANAALSEGDVDQPVSPGDILISQFEIPLDTVTAFFRQGKRAGATTVLNPAPAQLIPDELITICDVIVLNETELATMSGQDSVNLSNAAYAVALLNLTNAQTTIVTLGSDGALLVDSDDQIHVPGRRVEVIDTTGAGDCFVGALAAALASGASRRDALLLANKAASLAVQKPGAGPSMPTRSQVEALDA